MSPILCCAIFEPGMPVMYSRRVYGGLLISRYIEAGLSDIDTLGKSVAERVNKAVELQFPLAREQFTARTATDHPMATAGDVHLESQDSRRLRRCHWPV